MIDVISSMLAIVLKKNEKVIIAMQYSRFLPKMHVHSRLCISAASCVSRKFLKTVRWCICPNENFMISLI